MKKALTLLLALVSFGTLSAQKTIEYPSSADEVVHLWDNTSAKYSNHMQKDELLKGRSKLYNTSSADLYIYTAPKEKATGYSVVIYPGGGYRYLSLPHTFPEWLRENGITAVVVKYRLPNVGYPDATLEDAIGAVEYMRANAEKYNLDPQKLGVCGNSAGGHLAAWVSNAMEDGKKPHFSILVYGAMTRGKYFSTRNAAAQMCGEHIYAEKFVKYSTPEMVTATTPPALLLLSDDDTVVPPICSTDYYKALKRHGVPASMHIYPSGGHGWSGRMKWEYRQQWLGAVLDWIGNLENIHNRTKN
ncbi:MAG: alpha/beta hydrolase [Alistipes sp.]|nr:alpha/beta hydrolase [Alistipes sp.]